jgi:hypothetical protein
MSLGKAIDEIISALKPFEVDDQNAILSAVCTLLKLSNPVAVSATQPATIVDPPVREVPRSIGMDIKSLAAEKSPSNAVQMACLVAVYLQEHAPDAERNDTVNTADLDKYFRQAKFRMPNDIGSVLPNAKKAGYLDSAATRGEYKLTAVGYNLVVHNLPQKS